MTLNEIIQSCKRKERKAQRVLVDRFAPFLLAICQRYLHTREDAKDVLQEALISIFRNLDNFQGQEGQFKAWMTKITVNAALMKLRKASRIKEIYPGEMPPRPGYQMQVIDELNAQDVLRLLQYLPESSRQVFNLYVIDGFKHREIAEMLNITESSSRTALSRARSQLQSLIVQSQKMRS